MACNFMWHHRHKEGMHIYNRQFIPPQVKNSDFLIDERGDVSSAKEVEKTMVKNEILWEMDKTPACKCIKENIKWLKEIKV